MASSASSWARSRRPRDSTGPQRVFGPVVLLPPALPELDRCEGAQRPELFQRPPPPAAELDVDVGEVDQLHAGRSATARRPSPSSASSILTTRRPAASSSIRS